MGLEWVDGKGGLIDDALICPRVHLACSPPVYFGRGRTRGKGSRGEIGENGTFQGRRNRIAIAQREREE